MKLAIRGGPRIRTRPFPGYRVIGGEEKEAVLRVLNSGVLSKYLGCWHDDFMGGPEVRALEEEWADYFGVKHAIAVNSCTSGLYCCVGATRIEPGEEIIVSPYTMSASATAPLVYNAIPVFADIEEDHFCLSAKSVEQAITPRTRGIIVVDIFGQPYDREGINAVAKRHDLFVIEDAAQAPGAFYNSLPTGTLGDMGVFSLNYHKHIHCGEGGVVTTNSDEFAERVRLIRNHAEAVVEDKGVADISNLIGFNYRMTELEASIARSQLEKLKALVEERQYNCAYLIKHMNDIPSILIPPVRKNCTHAFYLHVLLFDEAAAGISRECYLEAVAAELAPIEMRESEGIPLYAGYAKPLYLQPLFQKKTAYDTRGFPFNLNSGPHVADYSKGICPVAERMYEKELFYHEMMKPGMSEQDLKDVVDAFHKVWENKAELEEEKH